MKWHSIVKGEVSIEEGYSSIQIPFDWIFPCYYDALNALFRIENTLRVLVYVVLKDKFRDKWINIKATNDSDSEEPSSTIGQIAKQRMNPTQRFGYLGHFVSCPLMYLTSGELIRLILSENYWEHFKPYFLGSKEIIKNKLDEISVVRNALAHFRPIRQDDIDLVKQNARHVLSKIESSLVDMMRCADVVPTNTQEEWYRQFRTLSTDQYKFSFNQSNDEKWVKVSFMYSCPAFLLEKSGRNRRYRALNLNTPAILHCFPQLKAFLILLSEKCPSSYHRLKEDETPYLGKSIAMIFSREVLITEYQPIKQQIEELLLKLCEETSLLQDDQLARGELVQAIGTSIRAECEDNARYCSVNYDDLKGFRCSVQEDSPPEYWGEVGNIPDDYVTSAESYPWMPVCVALGDIPF